MYRIFSALIVLGAIVWVFLLLQRAQLGDQVKEVTKKADNANATDRCAKYRMTDGGDEGVWSLGYEGRIRQLAHGCF